MSVEMTSSSFEVSFSRQRYLTMVRNRYMSLLSEFDDAALEAGIAQMDTNRENFMVWAYFDG